MRVRIDPARCTGHGQCAANAPEFYQLDELGYAAPLDVEVPSDAADAARLGAAACPEKAVDVLE